MRGFEPPAVPVLPRAPFLPSGAARACQLFKKVKVLGEKTAGGQERTIVCFVFQDITPQLAREGWTLDAQHLWGLGHGTATSLGRLRTLSLTFRTPHPPPCPGLVAQPPGRGRAPAPPGEGNSPARSATAEGGQAGGRGGPTGYAGAGPGETRRAGAGGGHSRLAATPLRFRGAAASAGARAESGPRAGCRRRARAAQAPEVGGGRGRAGSGSPPETAPPGARGRGGGAGRGAGLARARTFPASRGLLVPKLGGRCGPSAGAGALGTPMTAPSAPSTSPTVARNSLSPVSSGSQE